MKLYKVRWAGFGPSDDTWEPLRNVGDTGHVDRYFRRKRDEQLREDSPGAAIIEYDDGERTLVDLSRERFRRTSGDFIDSSNIESENDYKIVFPGAKLELYWPYADLFFSCRVISWTPLKDRDQIFDQAKTPSKPKAKKRAAPSQTSTKMGKPCTASKNVHLTKRHRDSTVVVPIPSSIGYCPKRSSTTMAVQSTLKSDTLTSNSSKKEYTRRNSSEVKTEAACILHAFRNNHTANAVTDEDYCSMSPAIDRHVGKSDEEIAIKYVPNSLPAHEALAGRRRPSICAATILGGMAQVKGNKGGAYDKNN
jgi:hypothetical protein